MKIKKTSLGLTGSAFAAMLILTAPFAQAEGFSSFLSKMTQPPLPKPIPQLRYIRDAMAKLAPDEYISFSPASPTSHVYILADADCPYTREMHKMVPEFNAKGIEIRYVAAPAGSLAGPAWTKYRNIWCSSNPKQAFDDAVKGIPISSSSCSDNERRTLAAQSSFMSAMPNTATPTTYFQDGFWITGTEAAAGLPEKANMAAKIVGQYAGR